MATPTTLPSSFTTGNVLTAAQMNDLRGAFRILQVVAVSYDTQASSATNTFVDTGLTASITPSATSSKILVVANLAGCYKDTSNTRMGARLMRGASEIAYFETYGGMTDSNATNGFGTCATIILDSPSTTSSTTYKVQFRSESNLSRVLCQVSNARSSIALLEVSA